MAREPPEPVLAPAAVPTPTRLVFGIPARRAWERVEKRMDELGFTQDRSDGDHQAILTRRRALGGKGLAWLPEPALPRGWKAKGIRFEVFVSPFVEPARVFVGSIVDARETGPGGGRRTAYNVQSFDDALMEKLAEAIGKAGKAVPSDNDARRRLVRSLLGGKGDPCLDRWPTDPSSPGSIPRELTRSWFRIPHPTATEGGRASGSLFIAVYEDGTVGDVRFLNGPRTGPFVETVVGTTSLRLFVPSRIDGCPVPTAMAYVENAEDSR